MAWSSNGMLATFWNAAQLSFLAALVRHSPTTEAYTGLVSDNNDGSDNWRFWSGHGVTWLEWAPGYPAVSNAMSATAVTADGITSTAGTSHKTFLCEIRVPGRVKLVCGVCIRVIHNGDMIRSTNTIPGILSFSLF